MPSRITHDSTTLHYSDWGDGSAVLFTHSWGLSGDMWSYEIPALVAAGLRCVTYDRRGHGRSDVPGRGYDLDCLADDLAGLIDHLDLHEVTLVGHSLGSKEIVRYVTLHGLDRVSRVVFVAPTTPFLLATPDNPQGVAPEIFAASETALRRDVAAWCADGASTFWGPTASVSPGLEDWTIRQIVGTPLPVLLETMRANVTTDVRDELKALDAPTLILHGDADVSAPLQLTGHPTAELLPDAELVEFPGIGHGIYLTEHERVAEAIIAFVDR